MVARQEIAPSEQDTNIAQGQLHAIPLSTNTMMAFCIDKSASPTAQLTINAPRPVPARGEALIRVLRAGICGTDLAMVNDYKPGFHGALGHEFVGVVEQIGGGSDGECGGSAMPLADWIGKRVVGEINIPCDDVTQCRVCRDHHSDAAAQLDRPNKTTFLHRNHCPHREALGILTRSGTFAQYITLPLANLLVVPDCVADKVAVFTEPLAAAYRILEQQVVQETDNVAVLGDGRLGLLVAEVLAVEKAAQSVTLVGRHREKLALVAGVVDATIYNSSQCNDTGNTTTPPLHKSHRDHFDVVVECTGTSTGISLALQIVRARGRVVMKSTCAQPRSDIPCELLALAAQKGIEIIGSRCGPFEPALRALEAARIDVTKYIAAEYPLERAEEAMAHAAQRGTLKVQLVISNVADLCALNQ